MQAQLLENNEGKATHPDETDYDLNYTKETAKDALRGTVPLSVSDTSVAFRPGTGTSYVTDVWIDRVSGQITETSNPDEPAKQIVVAGQCVTRAVAF